jgi:hypothetical protein
MTTFSMDLTSNEGYDYLFKRKLKSGLSTEGMVGKMGVPMPLEKELEAYRKKLPELKDSEGKFALVRGDKVVDVFNTYEDALKSGYQKFGLEPFMVKQISAIEQVHFISRFVDPCARVTA